MDILVKHTNNNSYSLVTRRHMKSVADLYNSLKRRNLVPNEHKTSFHATVRLLALAGF